MPIALNTKGITAIVAIATRIVEKEY